jgi:transglutaminase-like putative cysteine protease
MSPVPPWYTIETFGSLLDQPQTTLDQMQAFMDRYSSLLDFVLLARGIVAKAGAKNANQEAEAVNQWVQRTIEFRGDPVGVEWLQDPVVTLNERAGDCDDQATVVGTLLQALGHPCTAVGIQWKGKDALTHAACRDDLCGVIVDPVAKGSILSWPPPGYEVERIQESLR